MTAPYAEANGNLPPGQMTASTPAPDPRAAAAQQMMAQALAKPQRWSCAVCLGIARAWEGDHQKEIETAIALAQQQPGSAPGQFLDPALQASLPQVREAVTMATVTGPGLCYVCPLHVPPMADSPRSPLLIAPAVSNLAALVQGLG